MNASPTERVGHLVECRGPTTENDDLVWHTLDAVANILMPIQLLKVVFDGMREPISDVPLFAAS